MDVGLVGCIVETSAMLLDRRGGARYGFCETRG